VAREELFEPDRVGFKPLTSVELIAAPPAGEEMAARFGIQNWTPIVLSNGER